MSINSFKTKLPNFQSKRYKPLQVLLFLLKNHIKSNLSEKYFLDEEFREVLDVSEAYDAKFKIDKTQLDKSEVTFLRAVL